MTWKQLAGFGSVIVLMGACSESTTTPTPAAAVISATIAPNPVTATTCSPTCVSGTTTYQFRIVGSLTIQETAGLAGNVDLIVSGANISYNSSDIAQRSGTSHIAAHGTLTFPLSIVYANVENPTATRNANFPWTVSFTDDHGNHLTAVTTWSAN